MKYLPFLLVAIIVLITFNFTKRKNNGLKPKDYTGNSIHQAKSWLVCIVYCDNRPNDTCIFYYPEEPTSADIRYQHHDVNYLNYDVPIINNSFSEFDMKQFINPCKIITLKKL